MQSLPRRFILGGSILAGAVTPCLAWDRTDSTALPSAVMVALVSLLALGWGFHALLRRHLHTDEQFGQVEAQLGMERRARAIAERVLRETNEALAVLLEQQEQVRELERQRIARDIHDDLGQNLLALKIELSMMQVSTNEVHPMIHQKLGCMVGSLDTAIKSLRAIINDLRPLALEAGLQTAVEWQLSEFSRIHGIRYELNAGEHAFDPCPDRAVDAMVFRVLEEALANVARHAHATEVKVSLDRNGEQLTLDVQDNGVGLAAMRPSHGSGLRGIKDRVRAIGGAFEIDSQPGAGTLLSLTIPLVRRALVH